MLHHSRRTAESPPRKTHTASRNHVGKQSLAGTRKRNFRLQRHDDVKRLLQSFCRHGIYSDLPTRRMDIQRRTGKVVPEKLRLHRRSMDTSRKIRQVPAPIVAKAAKIFRHTDISRQDLFDKVGNGGLSLRRINSFIEACERYENEIIRFRKHCHHHYNEDVFWAIIPRNFKYPTAQEALGFAFDEKPELCYERNGQKLPFGCHGWSKERLYPFWKPFIPASPHS